MDGIIELVLQIFFELILDGALPALMPNKYDKRKDRVCKGIIAIFFFVVLIIIGVAISKNADDYKIIMIGISLIAISSLYIILNILRAKGFKYSLIYKLNLVIIDIAFTFGLIEGIVYIKDKNITTGGIIISLNVFISVALTIYMFIKMNKSLEEDKRVMDAITSGNVKSYEIEALRHYMIIPEEGHEKYYSVIGHDTRKLEALKDVLPFTMYEASMNALRILKSGERLERVAQADKYIRLLKSNLDRYMYRLVYSRIYRSKDMYVIAPIKPVLGKKIKDKIYSRKQHYLDRNIVARAILRKGDLYGLLKIECDDKFGHRDHYETIGGGVLKGEAYEDAVLREIKEETGIIATVVAPIGSISIEYNLLHRLDYCNFFLCDYVSEGEPNRSALEKKLIKGVEWFSEKEIIDLYSQKQNGVGEMIHRRDYIVFKKVFS